jgi:hypothetical protein
LLIREESFCHSQAHVPFSLMRILCTPRALFRQIALLEALLALSSRFLESKVRKYVLK